MEIALLASTIAIPIRLPPDPIRDEFVDRLRRHREEMAQELAARLPRRSEEQFKAEHGAEAGKEPEDLPFVRAWDLLNQARDLAHWCTQYREDLRRWRETLEVEQEPVTVEEMTGWLRVRLQLVEPGTEVEATALLEEQEMAGRRYCLFLGMLELVRAGEIGVSQAEARGGLDSAAVLGLGVCFH